MRWSILIALGCVLAPWLPAQTLSDDSEQKARELLRSVMEQRERQRNAPIQPAPQTPKISTAPAAPPKTTSLTYANPKTTPPTIPAPAPNLPPTGYKAPARQLTYAEIEQDYLAGKITAKQFQKFLRDRTLDATTSPSVSSQPNLAPENVAAAKSAPSPVLIGKQPVANPAPASAVVQPAPANTEPSPEQSNLGELEKKMEELLRLKLARDQANLNALSAATNTAAAATAPKSKRERMDALLRLYVAGKISEPEYNQQRAKLLAESEK